MPRACLKQRACFQRTMTKKTCRNFRKTRFPHCPIQLSVSIPFYDPRSCCWGNSVWRSRWHTSPCPSDGKPALKTAARPHPRNRDPSSAVRRQISAGLQKPGHMSGTYIHTAAFGTRILAVIKKTAHPERSGCAAISKIMLTYFFFVAGRGLRAGAAAKAEAGRPSTSSLPMPAKVSM